MKTMGVALLAVLLVSSLALATDVTFQVDMSYQVDLGNFDPAVDGVGINGSMNDWGGNPPFGLQDPDNDLIYTGTYDLTAGTTYEFKYVIWPELNPFDVIWEDGINNRVVDVGDDAVTLDVVWFNNNSPTVTNYEITFRVSMANVASFNPDSDGVVIRGSRPEIGNWGGFTALDRLGESLIYQKTIMFDDFDPPNSLDYKYVIDIGNNQADPVEWEQLGGPYDNRNIVLTGDEPDSDDDTYLEISQGPAWFSLTFPSEQGTMYVGPYNAPVEIPADGGMAYFEMWLHTTINNTFPGNLWLDVLAPNGTTYNLALVPFLFQPEFSHVFENLAVEIPGFAPAGEYEVMVKGGIYPNFAPISGGFTATKVGTGTDSGEIEFHGAELWKAIGE